MKVIALFAALGCVTTLSLAIHNTAPQQQAQAFVPIAPLR